MALEKRTEIEVVYTNDRMENDVRFSTNFGTLPKNKVEIVVVENAYFAIDSIEGNKNQLSFIVTTYKDSSRDCILSKERHTFVPDVSTNNTPNFYVQAYGYLKSLPDFSDAVDC